MSRCVEPVCLSVISITFDPFSQILVMDIPAVADVLVDAGGLIPGDQLQEQAVAVDAFVIRLQCLILALCDIVSALSPMEYEYPVYYLHCNRGFGRLLLLLLSSFALTDDLLVCVGHAHTSFVNLTVLIMTKNGLMKTDTRKQQAWGEIKKPPNS